MQSAGKRASGQVGLGPDPQHDAAAMREAIELAQSARTRTTPNPWVGAVVIAAGGQRYGGATAPPGGPHAEAAALAAAGPAARGATLFTTLEPCGRHGRTPPCVDAIVRAGVARVVVGLEDPDPGVSGRSVAALRQAGVDVAMAGADVAAEIAEQLAPYLKHRRTGRPWVVLKLAATLDGRIAAPDGGSRWITGAAARADAHQLRHRSDAVLVGAGTVRADDPQLTVRLGAGAAGPPGEDVRQPLRVVLGAVPDGARVEPALALAGEPEAILADLGARGVLQVLVEGGARVAHAFHGAGVVDRYVLYLAPALFGGDDAVPLFTGAGAATMAELWRGRLVSVVRLDDDIRVELAPAAPHERAA